MKKRQCLVCGHVYAPSEGDASQSISPGTVFENLPEEWICPVCGSHKDLYEDL